MMKLKAKPTGAHRAPVALVLPTAAKSAVQDLYRYVTLIYGRQGIGKSTWAASYPDSLMLSCERVSQGIPCFDFNYENGGVREWETFREAVELLTPGKKRVSQFRTVIVDTAAAAYSHCMHYVCKRAGVEHPHDKNDYGKTWDAVQYEFSHQLDRLWGAGYGVVFTAHSGEVEYKTHSGEEYTRIQPAVSGQAMKYLKAKTDCIFYAEYVKGADGKTRRILITEGDEVVEAKHPGKLPRYLPLVMPGGADLVARGFKGEAVGLKDSDVRPARTTSEQAAKMIERTRMGAAVVPTKKATA
jgi:hypothetical protein